METNQTDGRSRQADGLEDTLVQSTLQMKLTEGARPDAAPDDDAKVADAVARIDKPLGRRFFHLFISKQDIHAAVDILIDLTDAQMAQALQAIHAKGMLERLIEKAPDSLAKSRPGDMLRLYRNSPPSVLLAQCEDLLSLNLFKWGIDNGAAHIVIDILASLPQDAREQFIKAENGRYYDELMFLVDRMEAEKAAKAKAKAKQKSEAKQAETDAKGAKAGKGAKEGKAAKEAKRKSTIGQKFGAAVKLSKGVLFDAEADLNAVQVLMNGSISGLELDERGDNTVRWGETAGSVVPGAVCGSDQGGTDFDKGRLHVALAQLEAKRYSGEGVKTGAISMKGFSAAAKWRTEEDPNTYLYTAVNSLSIRDIKLDVADDKYEIGEIKVEGFELQGSDPPITQARPLGKGDGIKLLKRQVEMAVFENLPAVRGAFMSEYSKPATMSEWIASQFGSDMDIELDVAALKMSNVKKNGKLIAESMSVEGISTSVEDVLVADLLQEQVDALKAKPEMTPEDQDTVASLEEEISTLRSVEDRLFQLESRCEDGVLTLSEQDDLIELRNELKVARATLGIDKIRMNKIDVQGNGFESFAVDGVEISATGGVLDNMRTRKSRRQKLDDLLGARHKGAKQLEHRPERELVVKGMVDGTEFKGAQYGHEQPGDTGFDLRVDGMCFVLSGDDLSAGADAFQLNNLHFDPLGAQLGAMGARDLKLDANLKTKAMRGSMSDFSAGGIRYGKQGTSGFLGVDSVSSDAMGFQRGSSGRIEADVGKTTVEGIRQGDTKHGKGTNIRSVVADEIHSTIDGGNTSASVGRFDVEDIRSDAHGASVKRVKGQKLGYRQDEKGKSVSLDKLGVDGAKHRGSGGSMRSSSFEGIGLRMDNSGDTRVGVRSGQMNGLRHAQGSAASASFDGLSMAMGQNGMSADVSRVRGQDLYHRGSDTRVDQMEMTDLGFLQDHRGMRGGIGLMDLQGVWNGSNDVLVERITSAGITGGQSRDGSLFSDIESFSLMGAMANAGSGFATMERADLTDISLRMGQGGMSASVDEIMGYELAHGPSGTSLEELEMHGLGFRRDAAGMRGSLSMLDAAGFESTSMGLSMDGFSLFGASGGMTRDGVMSGYLGGMSLFGAAYDANGTSASMEFADISDVSLQNFDLSGASPRGDVDMGSMQLEDMALQRGDQRVTSSGLRLDGMFGSLDGQGGAIGGFDRFQLGSTALSSEDANASLSQLDLASMRLSLSGIGKGQRPSLDGLSLGSGDLSGVRFDANVGKMLEGSKAAPTGEQIRERLQGLQGVAPQDNTRVATPRVPDSTASGAQTTSMSPGSTFEASALSGASGSLTVVVPINYKTSLVDIKTTASLRMTVRNGRVLLSDIDIDLSWTQSVASTAADWLLNIEDYGLDVDAKGRVTVWLLMDTGLSTQRVPVMVFDGSKLGFEGGEDGEGPAVCLQKLVEALGSVKPQVQQSTVTPKAGPSSDTPADPMAGAREGIDAAEDFIDVGDVMVQLSGIKMSDGTLGNERFGASFVYSDQPGVNEVDAGLWVDGPSRLQANDVRMNDIYVNGDKPLTVESAGVQGAGAYSASPLDIVKGDGSVSGRLDKASLKGVRYGKDLSKDPRFRRRR